MTYPVTVISGPTSTEDETASEKSYYPKSEIETEILETKNEQPTETIEDQIKNWNYQKLS